MPTSHTLTGDLSDVVGTGFPRDSVWVTIKTNLGDNPVFDTTGEQIRFPRHRFALPRNAQFSKSLWSTAALTNPTGYQYGVEVEWPDGAGGTGKKRWFSGWFSLTADKDMSELDYGPMVPPEYYPELTVARDEAVAAKTDAEAAQAAAEAAQAAAEAVGDTNDTIMAGVASDSGSAFSSVLSASYAAIRTATGGDETTALNAWLSDPGPLGVKRLVGDFTISDALNVPANTYLDLHAATITQTVTGKAALVVAGDDVTVVDGLLVGPGYGSFDANQRAISIVGASAADPILRPRIFGTRAEAWGGYGIYAQHTQHFHFERFRAKRITYAGILGLSVLDGLIVRPDIDDVGDPETGTGLANAYGVALSRIENDSLVTHPRSARVDVIDGWVANIPLWEAYDTHGGEDIRFIGCRSHNTDVAVAIVPSDNTSNAETFPPLNCKVINYRGDSGVTDGTRGRGIVVEGVSGSPAIGPIIQDVELTGFGTENNNLSGAIVMRRTRAAVVRRATLIEPSPTGLVWEYDNEDYTTEDITVIDHWTNTSAFTAAVIPARAPDGNHTGRIAGITSRNAGNRNAATISNQRGIYYPMTTNVSIIDAGGHNLQVTTPQSGGTTVSRNKQRVPVEADGGITIGSTGTKVTSILYGSATWNPPSVATGAFTSTTVTVTGAAVGDPAVVGDTDASQVAGAFLKARVSAANTVTVELYNFTGSALDLVGGTVKVVVIKV